MINKPHFENYTETDSEIEKSKKDLLNLQSYMEAWELLTTDIEALDDVTTTISIFRINLDATSDN